MRNLRILIADDHALIRRGVRELLSARRSWCIVGEACTGAEAVAMSVALKPDVAVLDVSMPEMNGLEAAALISRQAPDTGLVFLTMHEVSEIPVCHRTFSRGRVVLKSDADRTLLDAVEAEAGVWRAGHLPSSNAGALGYASSSHFAYGASAEAILTSREREIMALLAKGSTSRETATALGISPRTVESHRSNMSRKLSLRCTADLVRYAICHGVISRD